MQIYFALNFMGIFIIIDFLNLGILNFEKKGNN